MKKLISTSALCISIFSFAQVNLNTNPNIVANSNAFIDASQNISNFPDSNIGRGIIFPTTDLSKFQLDTTLDDISMPTFYDGMIVYNTKNGGSTTDPNITQTDNLEPGFYYFYNPTGASTQTYSAGRWVKLGGGASTSVTGANVATGTFTHNGGTTATLGTDVPTDLKAITSIKIARVDDNGALLEGGVVSTTFYSYDKTTRTIVFGQGAMSTSMPKGNYSYTIEYTK